MSIGTDVFELHGNSPDTIEIPSTCYEVLTGGRKKMLPPGTIPTGGVSTAELANSAVTDAKINETIKVVTITAGQTVGTAAVTAGDKIIGWYPTAQDQQITSMAIADTTLTVTLQSTSAVDNVINVRVRAA